MARDRQYLPRIRLVRNLYHPLTGQLPVNIIPLPLSPRLTAPASPGRSSVSLLGCPCQYHIKIVSAYLYSLTCPHGVATACTGGDLQIARTVTKRLDATLKLLPRPFTALIEVRQIPLFQ